jgi:hypothetical protein
MRPTRGLLESERTVHTLCAALLQVTYQAAVVANHAGALLPHRFILTCEESCDASIGGLFSVARNVRFPQPGSRQHFVL